MQDLFRKRPGGVSTRVGHAGGDVPNATYRSHGTHAEAIEIVFDPERTCYRRSQRLSDCLPRCDRARRTRFLCG
jgi:peptide methionine sulfoxide reductase MsrA